MEANRFLSGKGSEYSKVAQNTEIQFQNWLEASRTTEQEFLEDLDAGAFQITLNQEKNKAAIYIHRGMTLIVQPLVWLKETGTLFSHFKVDAGLILMLIASKCSNRQAKEEIKKFVKCNLRVK